MQGLYRGFSSYEHQQSKKFTLRDVELVKLDLLNHIFTRKGERLMMPQFGTRIPDMAFEPLDELSLMIIEEDLNTVIAFDPRVSLVSMNIVPNYDSNTVVATVVLYYVELNMTDGMDINIILDQATN